MPRHVNERWSDYLGPGALSTLGFAALVEVLGLGLPVLHRLAQVLASRAATSAAPPTPSSS